MPDNDVYANPPDPEVLELEPVHPGIGDGAYVARRHELFARCRQYRLGNLGPPVIDYTDEEQRIWREVSPKLDELHQRHASRIYLQFIRHGSKPEFTPEPDMIHDCLGHVPPLVNHDYAELLTMIGKAAVRAGSGDHVLALKRLSWFSIEFGLIEEAGETRIFGAGILSSTGEIPYSLSPAVERRPFVTSEVVETDYDWSRMQELLFVIPSFGFLRREVADLVARMGIDVS
jgi:phenylalanine-4-hydroxylase